MGTPQPAHWFRVKEASDFATELDGVRADNLGGHVLVAVSPLVKDAANIGPKILEVNAADPIDGVLGKPNRRLRIGLELHSSAIPRRSRGIH